jgi:hypothetical protein
MSTAAETVMAHLSTFIFLSHARQKTERYSVGEQSPQADMKRVDDYVRGVGDQIEMVQYIRGRIGEDQDTVLDTWVAYPITTRESGCHRDFPKKRGRVDPRMRQMNMPWSQRRSTQGRLTRQRNAVLATKGRFIPLMLPLTPEIWKADGSSATEYDRGFSDTSDDERRGSWRDSFSVINSSEYSPVSDAELELREVETEGHAELLRAWRAQSDQMLRPRRSTT